MTEFCEICLAEGIDGPGAYFDKENWSWICSWCANEAWQVKCLAEFVPNLVTPEEFVECVEKMFK
jgi:hypothetical protein